MPAAPPSPQLNVFTRALRELCAAHLLPEKWLIAPSLRVGHQWLEAVTRSGQPIVNLRVVTLRRLALELASPEMEEKGLSLLGPREEEVLIQTLWSELAPRDPGRRGYLSSLPASKGLLRALRSTVRDLRLSGVDAAELPRGSFETASKAGELAALLAAYERALAEGKRVDEADVLRLAASRLWAGRFVLPRGSMVLAPEDARRNVLEQGLWLAIPPSARRILPVDRPETALGDEPRDALLLRWIDRPMDAPPPRKDGTVDLFSAVGEVNEVREVLRRCLAGSISFDEVEILHTEAATYVPAVFDLASRLAADSDTAPWVTFAEGLPARCFRPGRLLRAWVEWNRDGFSQATLVRMIRDGLLELPGGGSEGAGFARLAALLRACPIGSSRERYAPAIDAAIDAAGAEPPGEDEGRNATPRGAAVAGKKQALLGLRHLATALLDGAPNDTDDPTGVLEASADLLETHARCATELDEYSRKKLCREIRDLARSLTEIGGGGGSTEVWRWLSLLPSEAHVGGQGPRPGCLHVASVRGGGHSGRRHTFIVGLDDSRFPGAGLPDPVLLDAERRRISSDLSTAAGRIGEARDAFAHLLCRLRGRVTLSFSCVSLADDRELFPASVMLGAYRVVSGHHDADQDALALALGAPASFAPGEAHRCLDSTEWWLWRMCGGAPVNEAERVVGESFSNLGRGLLAKRERASHRFTVFDGFVPQAGEDLDPTKPHGVVLSPSGLERLGACPMEYFFASVLGLEIPEEYGVDPSLWLDASARGTLLHDVFCDAMHEIRRQGRGPDFARDQGRLLELVDAHAGRWRRRVAAPSEDVFARELEELHQVARVFLREEEAHCRESTPLYFEASVGLPQRGEGTPLDSTEPLSLELPSGKRVRVRGRIDRVDRTEGPDVPGFVVWDYKTGSSRRYREHDPFRGGRLVQSAAYLAMAEARMRETVLPTARATRFGYFFPGLQEYGRRISWPAEELARGPEVIEQLCEMLAKGCFPFSDDSEDGKYSDFAEAFGDLESLAEAVRVKLRNPANEALRPLRRLRGHEL
jgi:ATP-dependent helicase/nuclease subunit B